VEPSEGPGDWVDLHWLLTCGDDELLERLGELYIPGREPRWVRRNALVVLGNAGDPGEPWVAEVLDRHLRGDDAELAGHAAWAARRLGLDDLLADPDVGHRDAVRWELDQPAPPVRAAG
jgi:epoxyqueuosine reductase